MTNQIAVKDYIKQDSIMQSFRDVLGDHNASAYIASVLIAVANSSALQACTPVSVVTSAMRAATLRLSVDPSTGQAYLVPFKDRCTLIVGYKGLKDMALRTGQYRYLNVSKIYEGELITEDRITGNHSLSGLPTSKVVIGYLLYFELVNGFRKSFYMTVQEIHDHAQRYSRSYGKPDSPWKTNAPEMERKTVMRLGLNLWGYFAPHDSMVLHEIEQDDNPQVQIIDDEPDAPPMQHEPPGAVATQPKRTQEQIMLELGYDNPPGNSADDIPDGFPPEVVA